MENIEKKIIIEWIEAINSVNNSFLQKLRNSEKTNNNWEQEKYKASDFAKIVGCTQKTVYELIKRNEVKTIKEKIRGRSITFVIASNQEIREIRKYYNKY